MLTYACCRNNYSKLFIRDVMLMLDTQTIMLMTTKLHLLPDVKNLISDACILENHRRVQVSVPYITIGIVMTL